MTADAAGDDSLATTLRSRLGRRHPVAAAATVAGGVIRVATLGAAVDARFEIGSITKGVTALLYVDALERGEVSPETTLATWLPLAGCPAGDVTLSSLSTHTSGLPRLAPSPGLLRRSLELSFRGRNPYGESLDELLGHTRHAVVRATSRPHYSNLGYELLGHALASAAGTSYADLVKERVSAPLGLDSFAVAASEAQLGEGDLRGRSSRGRPMEAWTGEALGPAGGIRSSIGDMAVLAASLLDGTAPGIGALDPVMNMNGPAVRIGAAWIILEAKGRTVTWHNGGTGGFRSWMGLDRAGGSAVVILSATAAPVDRHGFDLLATLAPAP